MVRMGAVISGLNWAENKKEMAMNDGFRGVPGVPGGWELVRITEDPKSGEFALEWPNRAVMVTDPDMWELAVIVRKVEQPKRYRPFASAEEFKPHRDRWIRFAADDWSACWKVSWYRDDGVFLDHGPTRRHLSFDFVFDDWIFDDGTPFGVEVTDGE
jgi:hypothetical protein